MKHPFLSAIAALVIMACAMAVAPPLIVLAWDALDAHGQQPTKPDPKPVSLNADASAMWQRIDVAEDNLRQQFQVLEGQRQALLIGASVPKEFWPQCVVAEKIVVCAPPKPSPTK